VRMAAARPTTTTPDRIGAMMDGVNDTPPTHLQRYWAERIDQAIESIRDDDAGARNLAVRLEAESTRTGNGAAAACGRALIAIADMFAERPQDERQLRELLVTLRDHGELDAQRLVTVAIVGDARRRGDIEYAYTTVCQELAPLLTGKATHARLLAANVSGVTAQERDRSDEALRFFYAALNDAKTLGLTSRAAHISSNIGELLYMCGNVDEGEAILLEASRWVADCSERWLGPFTHVLLALCKLAKNEPHAALAVLEPYFPTPSEHYSMAASGRAFYLATCAYTLVECGDLDRAAAFCDEAHAAIVGLSERQLRPYAWWARGHLRHRRGELDAAVDDLETAVREVGDLGYVFMPMRATLELAEVHAERGHWEAAYRAHQRHLAFYDRVQSQASRTRLQLVQMQGALREAEHTARREQELGELKNRFLAMASHEFRTPLTAIQSATEVLLHYHDALPVSERQQIIGDIQLALVRLRNTMEQVLTMSRADAGAMALRLESMQVGPWCAALTAELARVHRRDHVECHVSADARDRWVLVDVELVQQAVTNLIVNAIKYSPSQSPVKVDVLIRGSHLLIRVADEGIGIPQADQPRLFEAFHRASNTGAIQGTGLGLTIVKRAVDAHGGQVTVESEEGKGSVFTLTLPCSRIEDTAPTRS
jgi:signal transduction histidine kinase